MASSISGYGSNPSDLLRTLQQMQMGYTEKAAKAAIAAKVQDPGSQAQITGVGRYLDMKA